MKLTINSIETKADSAHGFGNGVYHYNHQAKITAIGYSNGMEVELRIKMPYDYDKIPKEGIPLNVSISFDEVITTTKTIKLV